ncbi:hypothetical protein SAMN02787118_103396 [Streptomyces mirabilis]|uniref:Replication initiation protein n=1 Tax=Streptomyces mirabilis TaxID=68239 RepID=A0A1I2FC49_9ACTN|nr:hypothetical protein SAMN02787118_103396 [Streptomyces mirabilis]
MLVKSSAVTVWPAWLSWITTRWAIALTMPRPRPCVAFWSACSAFGAVPVPPSSVTDRATTWEETARARWKLPDCCPLAVWRIAFALSSLTISSASSAKGEPARMSRVQRRALLTSSGTAVLWNAHAGPLWRRFSTYLRREVAKRAGLSQRAFREHARVSFAKVAEYQKRGAVHFHAVIRIDGPAGGDTPPPAWATADLLTDAINAAAAHVRVDGPVVDGRAHTFTFGRQLDVRTIRSADFDGGQELTERAVASYIAKYATKGAETATGALDRPLKFLAELAQLDITDHARRMIRTAWTLGARKDLEDLRLRAWAHMLGFRGHFSTKSRRYSTTLGALRTARAEWRRAQATAATETEPDTTYVLAHWAFAGTGLSSAEAWLAASLEPAPGTEGEPTHA